MLYHDHTVATIDAIARRLGLKPSQVRKEFFLEPASYEIIFATPVDVGPPPNVFTRIESFFVNSDSAFVICETTYLPNPFGVAG